jgi:hypothetical protein
MAAKRLFTIIVLFAAITAIAVLQFQRYRSADPTSNDDDKFVSTYTELAVAREMFASDLDSLMLAYERVFSRNDTDSSWMLQHIESISDDTGRRLLLWERIVGRLDSLKNKHTPDTIFEF